jgi:hypothetical protein
MRRIETFYLALWLLAPAVTSPAVASEATSNTVWSAPTGGLIARLERTNRTHRVMVNLVVKNVSTNVISITDQPAVPLIVRDAEGARPASADVDFDGMWPVAKLIEIPAGEERGFRLRRAATTALSIDATSGELADRSGAFILKPGAYSVSGKVVIMADFSQGGWTGTIVLPKFRLSVTNDTYLDVYSRDNGSQ